MRLHHLCMALVLALLSQTSLAQPADRWVAATSLLVRADPAPSAPVLGRLQQGSRVHLLKPDINGDWCMVQLAERVAFVACRYLSAQPVALPRAGEGGVPLDRRWVVGSNLLLRAEPRPDAPVLARLALNASLQQTGDDVGNGYCAVQRVDGEPLAGYTACRYLQRSPLDMDRISQAYLGDGQANPDFDPVRAFWIAPSWELMAHHAHRLQQQREALGAQASQEPDEVLERMKALLSGQVAKADASLPVWPDWDALSAPRANDPSASLSLEGEVFQGEGAGRPLAFLKALPAPPRAGPSWWRSESDLAGPGEGLDSLAKRFGGQVVWLHESLQPGSPNRGSVSPGVRIERLTQPLQQISLMANQTLRDVRLQPQRLNADLDPTVDANCAGWVGGFQYGEADRATLLRNGFGKARGNPGSRPADPESLALFHFWSARPLPADPTRPPRWTRQAFKLDRAQTGFVAGEWRTVDVDGDGIPDLAWLQATGRGPGHLDGPPTHDDPWYRLLLANVAGRWRLLGTDTFAYGCGC